MTAGAPGKSENPIAELAFLADTAAMMPVLRRAVEPKLLAGWRIAETTVQSIRNRTYHNVAQRSKSSTLVAYDLSLVKSCNRRDTKQATLYVKGFLDGRGSQLAIGDHRLTTGIGALDAYAWLFPGDPALPGLATIADAAAVVENLPYAMLEGVVHSAADVSEVLVVPLRYKPEDRCTLRVTVSGPDGAPQSLIAKTFSSATRAAELNRTAGALWARSQAPGSRFNVPQPLGLDPMNPTMWLAALPGRTLRREDVGNRAVRRIAVALASFHRSDPITDTRRDPSDQLRQTTRKARILAQLIPALRPKLNDLVHRLEQELEPLEGGRISNIHGAFRLRQLILNGSDVGIIDFDSVAVGDPLEDVVDLLLDLTPSTGPVRGTRLTSAFVDAYEQASEVELDPRRLRWHLPIQILKRAYWLRHAAVRRPTVAAELSRRVHRACATAEQPLAGTWW